MNLACSQRNTKTIISSKTSQCSENKIFLYLIRCCLLSISAYSPLSSECSVGAVSSGQLSALFTTLTLAAPGSWRRVERAGPHNNFTHLVPVAGSVASPVSNTINWYFHDLLIQAPDFWLPCCMGSIGWSTLLSGDKIENHFMRSEHEISHPRMLIRFNSSIFVFKTQMHLKY